MKKTYKNNRGDYLHAVAFKLFLMKGYDATSISDIEKESGMTRGAITYYGRDKRGLFYDVVKHFVVDAQNLGNKMPKSNYERLSDFLEEYVRGCQETMDSFRKIDITIANGSRAYIALILKLSDFFPDLAGQYLENRNKELLMWIETIQKAVAAREIRDDTNVMATAKLFMNVFHGQSYLDALSTGLNTVELRMQFQNIYRMIKIDDEN